MSSDLDGRIRRIYAAIGETLTTDPSEFRSVTQHVEGGIFETKLDFVGRLSNEQMQNIIYSAVHNVASLRDHLKRWARQNGQSTDVVDQAVTASLELRVIIDLANRDKHGGPPRDRGSSGLSPDLERFRRGVVAAANERDEGSSVTIDSFGAAPQVHFGGSACVQIDADVVDGSGQAIGDAVGFLESGVRQWEQVLAQYRRALDDGSA